MNKCKRGFRVPMKNDGNICVEDKGSNYLTWPTC